MRRWIMAAPVLAAITLAGDAGGVGQKDREVDQIYDIYLGGLWIAEMDVSAEIGAEEYRAEAALRTKGIVGAFYKASFEAEAEGMVEADRLSTGTFRANSRDTRKSQFVEMSYRGGRPAALRAEPAFNPKPWEIEPTEQSGTADPLSAALEALTPPPGAEICNRTVEIYDGRKRYAVVMGEPEKKNDLIRCPAVYQRVGGFKPKMMAKPDFPFEFWFEPTGDGSYRLHRALGDTPIGTAVIRPRKG
ncbi:DUF3108 domain-containing protein [Rhodobacteraceae bacterium NNCM2]|nr:DUF3108 domain-containing protein [Coraliihabitans acroporae]